jgi:hypothetical protein
LTAHRSAVLRCNIPALAGFLVKDLKVDVPPLGTSNMFAVATYSATGTKAYNFQLGLRNCVVDAGKRKCFPANAHMLIDGPVDFSSVNCGAPKHHDDHPPPAPKHHDDAPHPAPVNPHPDSTSSQPTSGTGSSNTGGGTTGGSGTGGGSTTTGHGGTTTTGGGGVLSGAGAGASGDNLCNDACLRALELPIRERNSATSFVIHPLVPVPIETCRQHRYRRRRRLHQCVFSERARATGQRCQEPRQHAWLEAVSRVPGDAHANDGLHKRLTTTAHLLGCSAPFAGVAPSGVASLQPPAFALVNVCHVALR